jgi:hypothetical protein
VNNKQVHIWLAGIITGSLLAAVGCDETFEPKGAYQERIVLYSILTTRSDSQFVRAYSTYNPSGHNPLENSADTYLRNATVTLTRDSSTTRLTSAIVPRIDKSRYTDDITAYMAYPYRIQPGSTCRLNVSSEKGNVQAVVEVPSKGDILANNPFVLKEPDKYDEDISVRIRHSAVAQGYLVRIILEFETRLGSQVTRHQEEIPQSVLSGGGIAYQFEYPKLTRRDENNRSGLYRIEYFTLDAYKTFLVDLKSRYGAITLSGATYVLTQVDRNLYIYYNLVNGFQDPFSIRTDLPDFTSIQGGLGLFGALVEDSLRVSLR